MADEDLAQDPRNYDAYQKAIGLSPLMGPQWTNMLNARVAVDDARDRNRLRYMQMREMQDQYKKQQSVMNMLSQNPFDKPASGPMPQQPPMPGGLQPNPSGSPQSMQPAGMPSPMQEQYQAQAAQAQQQMEIKKRAMDAKSQYDRILATGNQEALSSFISDMKQDKDLGQYIPKDLEIMLSAGNKEQVTYTKDFKEGELKAPNGQPLPAGKYKTTWQGSRVIGIELQTADKNLTKEQLTQRSLRGDTESTSILNEMERRDLRIARERSVAGSGDPQSQAKEIGDAIMRGEQSPIVSGFGMAKVQAPLKTYLAKQGYNLKTAELDFRATQRYLSTLNGPQQLRLRQAVTFAYDSLPLVEELAKEWNGGGFAPLNRTNLMAARNGVYGQKAQSIATRFEAQINDLSSELGTVYKGGNSSTDESLKLAASNLKSDWSYKTLMDNITQIRRNLGIRKNSISSVGVAGLSESTPQAAGGTPTPSAGKKDLKTMSTDELLKALNE